MRMAIRNGKKAGVRVVILKSAAMGEKTMAQAMATMEKVERMRGSEGRDWMKGILDVRATWMTRIWEMVPKINQPAQKERMVNSLAPL